MTTIAASVSTIAQLNNEIVAIDSLAASSGTSTITLTGNIALGATALEAINLNTGNVLDIIGNGFTLSGGGTTTPERGLFVYAGTVSVANLTIANMDAKGGNGAGGGGGGAGLGGGLFVASNVVGDAGNVTLNNVSFSGDRAVGGAGGSATQFGGGGGGMGGNGGAGSGGGGGGGGLGGNGGGGGAAGSASSGGGGAGASGGVGIVPRGAAGGAAANGRSASGSVGGNGGGGGISGGGGGGGGGSSFSSGNGGGGGGGIGGSGGTTATGGGGGGFGGGGGGNGGAGGFGGGGAGNRGIGGFGGGGGGTSNSTGGGGAAGFGAGSGSIANSMGSGGGGGGGLSAGGDIFVQAGASLTIEGNASTSIAAGTVVAGTVAAGTTASAGQALGAGIYVQGTGAALTFNSNGTTETIAAPITDDTGSGGTGPAGYTKGSIGIGIAGTGTVVLSGTNSYTGGTSLQAGVLDIASSANIGAGTVTFGAVATTLQITGTQTNGATFANVFAGFQNDGTIDLTAVNFVSGASATVSGTTLTLHDGSFTEKFSLAATTAKAFRVSQDSGTGTELTSVCFLAGTRIATPSGDRAIETLTPGDMASTFSGQARRIVWIGKGKILATRGSRTPATPVIVKKGAFADNVPYADLRVTKAHGFYLDRVLIPAEFLVNNRSVLWDDRAQEVEIYHIELETHDVILANGAPAETYRDDGNRWLFQNANSGWGLSAQPPCAPVLTGGPQVDAVWRRLLHRAGSRPSLPLTEDPDLHLLIDGLRLNPEESAGPHRVFYIPGKPARVEIASRDAVPAELGLARDPRSLGVALRRIEVRRGESHATIEADDPRLTDGFHAFEPAAGIRWTNGKAAVPSEVLAVPGRGAVKLILTLGGTTRYPAFAVAAA